jgi:hypothetical protein
VLLRIEELVVDSAPVTGDVPEISVPGPVIVAVVEAIDSVVEGVVEVVEVLKEDSEPVTGEVSVIPVL